MSRLSPHFVVLFACVSIVLAALALTPAPSAGGSLHFGPLSLPPVCTFQNFTGLPCPGCGLSRSLVSGVRGDFRASWSHHRLGLLTLAYVLIQLLFRLGAVLSPSAWRRVFPSERGLNLGLAVLGLLFIMNWIFTLSGV